MRIIPTDILTQPIAVADAMKTSRLTHSLISLIALLPALLASFPLPCHADEAAPAVSFGQRVTVGDTTYIGDFLFEQPSGLASGQGRVEWRNGDSYEGRIERGLREGHGIFIAYANSIRYEGEWTADLQNGKGKTTFSDGDIYEGEMRDGQFHGQGSYLSEDGSRYDGAWQNGIKEGFGKMTFPDGDNWEGRFSNDQRTTDGRMNFTAQPLAEAEADLTDNRP